MRLLKHFNCTDCGKPTSRFRHPHQPLICIDCGIDRAVAMAVALANAKLAGWPEGGEFDREQFARPMRERWQRLGKRGRR